jgi:hypothetical protein
MHIHAEFRDHGHPRFGGDAVGSHQDSLAVAAARGACRLPYLIGAAPVLYGAPPAVGQKRKAAELGADAPSTNGVV